MIGIKNEKGEEVVPDKCWQHMNDSVKVEITQELPDVSHVFILAKGKDFKFDVPTHDQVRLFTEVYLLLRNVGAYLKMK